MSINSAIGDNSKERQQSRSLPVIQSSFAASMKVSERLMTVVQEKQGTRKFALPKGLKAGDIVKRDTYNLGDMMLISSEPWDSSRTKPSRLPTGVKNIHT
eukprot:4768754-Amphidinium_carterae.1